MLGEFIPKVISGIEFTALCRPHKITLQSVQTMSFWSWLCAQGRGPAGAGLELLVDRKENFNVTAYKNIQYNGVLLTVEEGPEMDVMIRWFINGMNKFAASFFFK